MPEFEKQLRQTASLLDDRSQGIPALERSVAEADRVLLEIKGILDRMLELESYNEVVALLRGIISDQDELNDRTRKRKQSRVRSLLED